MSINVSYHAQSLIHMPKDVLAIIVGKLGLRDVVVLSKVCKRFADIANRDTIWENLFVKCFSRKEFVDFEKKFRCQGIPTNKIKFQAVYKEWKKNLVPTPSRPQETNIITQAISSVVSMTARSVLGVLVICVVEAVSIVLFGIAEYKKNGNRTDQLLLQIGGWALPAIAFYNMDEDIRGWALMYGTIIVVSVAIPIYALYKTIAGIAYAILSIVKNLN